MQYLINAVIVFMLILGCTIFSAPLHQCLWMVSITAIVSRTFGISDSIWEGLGIGLLSGFLSLILGGGIGWLINTTLGTHMALINPILLFQTLFAFTYDGN